MIIEIAIGVFVGGLALWFFKSFQDNKNMAIQENGQLSKLFKTADEFIEQRIQNFHPKYIAILKERLSTIFDDPELSTIQAASVEWESFTRNFDDTKVKLSVETQEVLKESLLLAERLGKRKEFVDHIANSINSRMGALIDEGMLIYATELKRLGEKN
jgi:hypothetical protein